MYSVNFQPPRPPYFFCLSYNKDYPVVSPIFNHFFLLPFVLQGFKATVPNYFQVWLPSISFSLPAPEPTFGIFSFSLLIFILVAFTWNHQEREVGSKKLLSSIAHRQSIRLRVRFSSFYAHHVLVSFLLAPILSRHPPFEVQKFCHSFPHNSSYMLTWIPSRIFYISQECTISHPALKLSEITQVLSISYYIFLHACDPHYTPPTKGKYLILLNMFLQRLTIHTVTTLNYVTYINNFSLPTFSNTTVKLSTNCPSSITSSLSISFCMVNLFQ